MGETCVNRLSQNGYGEIDNHPKTNRGAAVDSPSWVFSQHLLAWRMGRRTPSRTRPGTWGPIKDSLWIHWRPLYAGDWRHFDVGAWRGLEGPVIPYRFEGGTGSLGSHWTKR